MAAAAHKHCRIHNHLWSWVWRPYLAGWCPLGLPLVSILRCGGSDLLAEAVPRAGRRSSMLDYKMQATLRSFCPPCRRSCLGDAFAPTTAQSLSQLGERVCAGIEASQIRAPAQAHCGMGYPPRFRRDAVLRLLGSISLLLGVLGSNREQQHRLGSFKGNSLGHLWTWVTISMVDSQPPRLMKLRQAAPSVSLVISWRAPKRKKIMDCCCCGIIWWLELPSGSPSPLFASDLSPVTGPPFSAHTATSLAASKGVAWWHTCRWQRRHCAVLNRVLQLWRALSGRDGVQSQFRAGERWYELCFCVSGAPSSAASLLCNAFYTA
jgi:hypothetical protein